MYVRGRGADYFSLNLVKMFGYCKKDDIFTFLVGKAGLVINCSRLGFFGDSAVYRREIESRVTMTFQVKEELACVVANGEAATTCSITS